jgi:hypothetical protein
MADYDNNLSGVLFKNDKGDNEKRPDYKGSAEIEGVQYWVSAWIRDTAQSTAAPASAPKPVASAGYGDIDSEIPF